MLRDIPRTQVVVDAALAGVFFLTGIIFTIGTGALDVALLTVFAVASAFRRLSPTVALSVAWAAAIVQMACIRDVQFGNLAVLAVLHGTAAYGGRVVRWVGLGSAALGALLATLYLGFLLPLARGFDMVGRNGGVGDIVLIVVILAGCFAVLALAWTTGFLQRALGASRESRRLEEQATRDRQFAQYRYVVEQERGRIARDMHDVVAHSLAVVIAQSDGARYAARTRPETVEPALQTIATTARDALGEVRLLLAAMRHSEGEMPQPTLADVPALLEQMRSTGLDLAVTIDETVPPLGAGHELAAYRILQEALTNALRHGDSARPVEVSVVSEAGGVRLVVRSALTRDDAPARTDQLRHGVPGMRERAELAGGRLSVGPDGRGAFVVDAWIPRTGERNEL
ncbi:sensor histidine kinase [Agromyces atrinae]|uniref:histidine kinase n=1 Tax=Agromyces atrinae TaxID=592376 RepID=A0A4Q2M3H4_9MICO|nr:histidine kinase [Agromyces atrinae]NYD66018.1 signal transduction histidine kinase [Agromyces atrinae]RXZ86348.1 sensor histidine kinase [Agromyces atrinae]